MAINFPSRSKIESLNKLAEGGEATIYEYGKDVLKIFKPSVNLAYKEKKVKFFISIKKRLPNNVIGPKETVEVNGNFVGYSMKRLNKSEDLHMLTKPKFLATSNLSNKDVLNVVTQIGKNLNELHRNGILVGDISDYNFQIKGTDSFFIDVDSWGISGKYDPDAYTELFTCPDSYNFDGSISFSQKCENYNFAVLAFNMLTKIHPFGGTYLPNKNLSILDRMKKKISVVGNYRNDIKLPKIIGSWKWMSPVLEEQFRKIFEQDLREDITPLLEDLLQNMKYCQTHNIYYYSKYNECPLCNEDAKVRVEPIVTQVTKTSHGPQITIVFAGTDCSYILGSTNYLNTHNEVVHFGSNRTFNFVRGQKVDFSNDGKIVFISDEDTIKIYNEQNQLTATIDRMNNSNYLVKDRDLYYVDKGEDLVKLSITQYGNLPHYLGQVYAPIFEVSDDGKVFIVSMYPKKAIINTPDYTFELDYLNKIKEYAIKYDKATNKWLFVYQLANGKYRTVLFGKNHIEYDDDIIMYNAQTLSNIDFFNNTIYDPSDGKIVGTNIVKNVAKEFSCDVVDENSKLEFTGKGFKIYTDKKIYSYG